MKFALDCWRVAPTARLPATRLPERAAGSGTGWLDVT